MNDIINIYYGSNTIQLLLNNSANDNYDLILDTIKDFENEKNKIQKIYVANFDEAFKKIHKKYPPIIACGGVVENEHKELLFIFRRKKWDLPKGKLDKGETPEQCAIREVQEETGLKNVELKDFLCHCYHIYNDKHKKKLVTKQTYWYKMSASKNENLIPQTEEDIEEIKWIAKSDLNQVYANTFDSIKEVLGKKYF